MMVLESSRWCDRTVRKVLNFSSERRRSSSLFSSSSRRCFKPSIFNWNSYICSSSKKPTQEIPAACIENSMPRLQTTRHLLLMFVVQKSCLSFTRATQRRGGRRQSFTPFLAWNNGETVISVSPPKLRNF